MNNKKQVIFEIDSRLRDAIKNLADECDVSIKELIKRDFKVLLLDVTDFQEGEKQIVYTKESILSAKDISQLFS